MKRIILPIELVGNIIQFLDVACKRDIGLRPGKLAPVDDKMLKLAVEHKLIYIRRKVYPCPHNIRIRDTNKFLRIYYDLMYAHVDVYVQCANDPYISNEMISINSTPICRFRMSLSCLHNT
jgi:hypothetical protein